jgi:hypothetical protein
VARTAGTDLLEKLNDGRLEVAPSAFLTQTRDDVATAIEELTVAERWAKRSLASREFALGVEALERFVRKEPLRRTHESVFGVLALESEPVDPRL